MKATIWHNPRCWKSREALALLEAAGAEITIVDYQKAPPPRAEIARVLARAAVVPRAAMRTDAPAQPDDAAALDAMAANPAWIERPLVETARGVVIARPPERVREIL